MEIEEDKDELDEKNENMLNQIDKQVKRGDMNVPVFIDATQAKRTIRTATYGGKKDVKTIIETENNDLNPYFLAHIDKKWKI